MTSVGWVKMWDVGVPALRPRPGKRTPAPSVRQVVAVRLSAVVVPEKSPDKSEQRQDCCLLGGETETSPVPPHAFVLRADVSWRRKSLSAATVVISPSLSAAVPVPENTKRPCHNKQTMHLSVPFSNLGLISSSQEKKSGLEVESFILLSVNFI